MHTAAAIVATHSYCLLMAALANSYAIDAYPTPGTDKRSNERCGTPYFGDVQFICDPDSLLSRTAADLLIGAYFNGSNHRRKQCACLLDRRTDDCYNVAIALAKNLEFYSPCLSPESGPFEETLANFTERWTRASSCDIDLAIVCVKEIRVSSTCGHRTRRPPTTTATETQLLYWMSGKLRRPFIAAAASEASRRRLNAAFARGRSYRSAETFSNGHCDFLITQFLRDLSDSLRHKKSFYPYKRPLERPPNQSTKRGPSLKNMPNSSIDAHPGPSPPPLWAIVVFMGAVLLSCTCILIGHIVNRAASGLRRRTTRVKVAGNGAPLVAGGDDRKWRAGFGGGLFDAGEKRKPAAGLFQAFSGMSGRRKQNANNTVHL